MNDGPENDGTGLVADYKRQLQAICDKRPSGTRGRLAHALGTNRSFVSQLVNPIYSMPIPPQHLEKIVEVCHFSQAERRTFLAAYDRAHPGRRAGPQESGRIRNITLGVPDLGHARKNQAIEELLRAYAEQLVRLVGALAD
jgi:hypothetical protein